MRWRARVDIWQKPLDAAERISARWNCNWWCPLLETRTRCSSTTFKPLLALRIALPRGKAASLDGHNVFITARQSICFIDGSPFSSVAAAACVIPVVLRNPYRFNNRDRDARKRKSFPCRFFWCGLPIFLVLKRATLFMLPSTTAKQPREILADRKSWIGCPTAGALLCTLSRLNVNPIRFIDWRKSNWRLIERYVQRRSITIRASGALNGSTTKPTAV